MDLLRESQRLHLDLLAVQVSRELERAGIPHALLKGPSTANWLYDPPRPYSDVDMLVPHSRVEETLAVLRAAGIADSVDGLVGEAAWHSVLVRNAAGFQLDLHISLPALPPAGDTIWDALSSNVEPLKLDVGTVPALDIAGRCLVLALHGLNPDAGQAGEDLRRAHETAGPDAWRDAAALAEELDAADFFDAGLATIGAGSGREISARAYLIATAAPSVAFGWRRLMDARRRDLPRLVWHEIFPSVGFMRHAYPEFGHSAFGLVRAHLRRWGWLTRQVPDAVRALRASRMRQRR